MTAAPGTKTTSDFDFLTGTFDVVHRRLVAPLTGSTEWEEHAGTCTARTAFDGAVSIDEMQFPTRGHFGMSVRLFDPVAREWSVYWVDSRTGTLQPPVRGRWEDGACEFVGADEHDGRPILAAYRWSAVTATTAHWEQGFSVDGGVTWETNWTMEFTRRATPPPRLDIPAPTSDFDFLRGDWTVAHHRLDAPLSGATTWTDVPGTAHGWTHFDGAASLDENDFPGPSSGGLTLRLFDPAARQWSIWWVTRRDGVLTPPVRGGFDADGVGRFHGFDTLDGRPVEVRFRWTRGAVPVWEQSFSADGGTTWEPNWRMTFTR
ncbi:hypothetical protein [Pseudonocardia sp. GCM10023141]|uniref:hypothetical protein n=1 Tax=Pseudonocardia sp. GCM10023141 TaxID=3252653 RepID=UPI00360E6989